MLVIPILASLILFSFFGIREARNVKNLNDFAFSKGAFNTFTLITTIVASFVGGGVVIGTAEKCYVLGIAPAFALIGFSLQLLLTALFGVNKIYLLDDGTSTGSILERYYGKAVKCMLGLCWTFFCVGILSAQMLALGRLLHLFVPISPALNNFIASFFLILYCLSGGIRAVVLTDRLQFVLMSSIVPMLLLVLCVSFYRSGFSFVDIPSSQLNLFSHLSFTKWSSLFLGFLLGDALIPPVVQRIQLARSSMQAKKALMVSSLIVLIFTLICGAIGLFFSVMHPGIAPENLIETLFSLYLPAPIQTLGVIAFLAVIMSSADSYLNSLAYVFVSDVLASIKKTSFSEKGALYAARWTTFILGLLAFSISVYGKNSFDLLLQSYKFWGPLMFVPIFFALHHQFISKKQLVITWSITALMVLFWDLLKGEEVTSITSLLMGVMTNLACFSGFLVYSKFKAPLRLRH